MSDTAAATSSAAGRWDWLANASAHATLALPRFSLARLLSPPMRVWLRRMGARSFHAATPDGVKLDALHLPAPGSAPAPAPGSAPETVLTPAAAAPADRLPVVIVHGYLEVKEFHLRETLFLHRAGHDVILLDLRAHGRSTGRGMTFGALEKLDVRSVIDRAQQLGLVGDRLATLGVSLGAATVLQHAAIDPRVRRVVAVAPFASGQAAVRSYRRLYFKWFDENWALRGFDRTTAGYGFKLDDADTLAAVASLDAPALIVVGSRDRNLGLTDHAGPLHRSARSRAVRLRVVPGAHHFNIVRRKWPGLDEDILAFLQSPGT